MPRQKQGGAHTAAFGWYALRGATNQDAAGEFIRVASSAAEIVEWSKANFTMPTRKAAASAPGWATFLRDNPLMQAFNETLPFARAYPPALGWSDAINLPGGVAEQIAAAREGKIAARSALDEAARFADSTLERARQAAG
jgi:ABC-type glycerol-3-phosphate transport system substrate-binding protein